MDLNSVSNPSTSHLSAEAHLLGSPRPPLSSAGGSATLRPPTVVPLPSDAPSAKHGDVHLGERSAHAHPLILGNTGAVHPGAVNLGAVNLGAGNPGAVNLGAAGLGAVPLDDAPLLESLERTVRSGLGELMQRLVDTTVDRIAGAFDRALGTLLRVRGVPGAFGCVASERAAPFVSSEHSLNGGVAAGSTAVTDPQGAIAMPISSPVSASSLVSDSSLVSASRSVSDSRSVPVALAPFGDAAAIYAAGPPLAGGPPLPVTPTVYANGQPVFICNPAQTIVVPQPDSGVPDLFTLLKSGLDLLRGRVGDLVKQGMSSLPLVGSIFSAAVDLVRGERSDAQPASVGAGHSAIDRLLR